MTNLNDSSSLADLNKKITSLQQLGKKQLNKLKLYQLQLQKLKIQQLKLIDNLASSNHKKKLNFLLKKIQFKFLLKLPYRLVSFLTRIISYMVHIIPSFLRLIHKILKQRIIVWFFIELMVTPILLVLCFLAKKKKNKFDIGLGPYPLINNIHHKKALQKFGYTVETFVWQTYFITQDFDLILDKNLGVFSKNNFIMPIACIWLFVRAIFRYKCLYIYFNGGPLGIMTNIMLNKLEPYFFKIASTKLVLMPYGADVHDMRLSPNLLFKYSMSKDYPNFKICNYLTYKQVQRWTNHADHIISGCEWVYYMYHWDTLMLSHFSIDTEKWKPKNIVQKTIDNTKPLKILHAPNHKTIKGSKHFFKAIKELKEENYPIELIFLQKKHNNVIKDAIEKSDIVADQLIMGWYALFAIEAMALGKPVICYLKDDLIELYEEAGLIKEEELPFISCSIKNLKDQLKHIINNREILIEIGQKSREFVIKHHSLEAVGKNFDKINKSLGIIPQK